MASTPAYSDNWPIYQTGPTFKDLVPMHKIVKNRRHKVRSQSPVHSQVRRSIRIQTDSPEERPGSISNRHISSISGTKVKWCMGKCQGSPTICAEICRGGEIHYVRFLASRDESGKIERIGTDDPVLLASKEAPTGRNLPV